MTDRLTIAQALGNAGVLTACVANVLIWTELGWFVCGVMEERELDFMAAVSKRGMRCAAVEGELEALQQASLWQIADNNGRLAPRLAAEDLLGFAQAVKPKRPKYLRVVK